MIKAEHLTKYYGDFCAVDGLSFEIDKGQVYGFLGPNGAGKSTTMNIMTGCLSAAGEEKVKRIMAGINSVYRLRTEETGENFTRFSVKTDSRDICRPVKEMFFAFGQIFACVKAVSKV